eukprot:317524_1
MTMRTLRGLPSIRSKLGSSTRSAKTKVGDATPRTPDTPDENGKKMKMFKKGDHTHHSVNHSDEPLKHPGIEINFTNDIKSSDLDKSNGCDNQ